MAINVQRNPRKTEFWSEKTPAVVGPGVYDKAFRSSFDKNRDAPAPFNSTKERTVAEQLNQNPGPGNYSQSVERVVPKVQEKKMNCFQTGVPRFCPTAPGSGLIKGPTYLEDPDPGHYHQTANWRELKYLDKTLLKYKSAEHNKHAVIPNYIAPSIPARKMAATAYTGRGFDQVGPAAYNPNADANHKLHPQYQFHLSKQQRKLWQQTNMADNDKPWANNPGPGVYDWEKKGQERFNASGQDKVFQSKVPNCKDAKIKSRAPGPGNYQTTVSIEKTANEHIKQTADGQFIGQEPQSFLTKTARGEFWKHEGETPYTRQTFAKVPGPGTYNHEKKKDDIRNRIVEDTVHPPFASSDDRPCNKKVKAPNPGPGTYIDIYNPGHCSLKAANLNKEERTQQEEQGIKLGPFGANKDRFFNSWLDPRDGPDPGQYGSELVRVQKQQKTKFDLAIEGRSQASTRALTASQKERTKPNSVFLSTTDRFKVYEKLVGIGPNRTDRSVEPPKMTDHTKSNTQTFKSTNDVLRAADLTQYDFKDARTTWTGKGRAPDYEVFSGKNIGFDKTSPRFNYDQVFYGQSLKFGVPGPGYYPPERTKEIAVESMPKNKTRAANLARPGTFQQPRSKTMKKNMAIFDTQEQRFKMKGLQTFNHQAGTNYKVGPGSYGTTENSMLKKSFNMSMEHSYFV